MADGLQYGWSGAADALQEILAARRNEQRQAMLDEITSQNAQSTRDYQKEMADSARASRESLAEERTQRTKDLKTKEETERERKGRREKFFDEGNDMSLLYQLPWEVQQNLRAAYQVDPESVDDLLKAMVTREMAPQKQGGDVFSVKPTGIEDTGIWDPNGPQYVHLPIEPREPQPRYDIFTRVEPDPNDPTKTVTNSYKLNMNTNEGPNEKNRITGGINRVGTIPQPRQAFQEVPPQISARLQMARAAYVQRPDDPVNLENLYGAIEATLGAYRTAKVPEDLISLVQQVIAPTGKDAIRKHMSADQVMNLLKTVNPSMTPEDIVALNRMFSSILPAVSGQK